MPTDSSIDALDSERRGARKQAEGSMIYVLCAHSAVTVGGGCPREARKCYQEAAPLKHAYIWECSRG